MNPILMTLSADNARKLAELGMARPFDVTIIYDRIAKGIATVISSVRSAMKPDGRPLIVQPADGERT